MMAPLLKEKGFAIDGKVVTFAQPRVFLKAQEKETEKGKEKEKETEEQPAEEPIVEKVRGAGREWYDRCLRDIPLLRVNMNGDPTLLLFPNCEQLGAEVLLLSDTHFSYSQEPIPKDPSTPPSFRELEDSGKMALHSMDQLLKNVKTKIREAPQLVPPSELNAFLSKTSASPRGAVASTVKQPPLGSPRKADPAPKDPPKKGK